MNTASGVCGDARLADTPLKCFHLFFTESMISTITKHTNESIARYTWDTDRDTDSQANLTQSSKYTWVRLTDSVEMKAYIGLCYLRGLFQQNNWDYKRIFANMIGHPVFSATMSANRFCFLNRHFSMDDAETREERWQTDRLAACRDIHEEWNDNCSAALQADDFMAIDECLYACRNQISIKQYNPNKPAKYGLLIKELNSVRVPYTHRSEVYAGKPVSEGPYYLKSVEELTLRLVDKYSEFCEVQGRNITVDNLYTSISLAKKLLERGITVVGTLRSNRKGIPKEVKDTAGREENSYMVLWDKESGKITLHSFVVKTKSKGMKNITLLSTHPPILGVTKDDTKFKPAIYKLYDFSKGNIDNIISTWELYFLF